HVLTEPIKLTAKSTPKSTPKSTRHAGKPQHCREAWATGIHFALSFALALNIKSSTVGVASVNDTASFSQFTLSALMPVPSTILWFYGSNKLVYSNSWHYH
ncbi:MAG: hypothetical protein ACRC4U_10510, partial [Shewanella sp.]